ncbi:hypothetical protein PybrP1_002711 [[Pythium] brassicae (nom. inval.)]|nr:hypothetical protein PybrP1_002711 [[Pythium] brassicae (nom. inval.)]
MSTPKLPVPLNTTFKFDGSSSDFAQQLYQRYANGATAAALDIAESKLPTRIQERLSKSGASFAALPGILQRALVWDSGYALDYTEKLLVEVWTLGGRSMADIAVSASEYRGPAGCSPSNCTSPAGGVTLRSHLCNGEQMLRVTKCMAADVANPSLHSPMWSLGVDPELTPRTQMLDHSWVDDYTKVAYSVYAIHTEETRAVYDVCPKTGYDAFVIPCFVKSASNATTVARMAEPATSAWVDTVLAAFPKAAAPPSVSPSAGGGGTSGTSANGGAAATDSGSSGVGVGAIVGIIAGVLVLLGALAFFVVRRRRSSQQQQRQLGAGGVDPSALLPPGAKADGMSGGLSTTTTATVGGNQLTTMARHTEDFGSSSSNAVLRTLLTDANLADRRLVYEKIAFGKMLSKGAYGEVWVCEYEGQRVAILNDVMAGTLHPGFTPECPPRVRKVAQACFERDPSKRPSASELVKLLEG